MSFLQGVVAAVCEWLLAKLLAFLGQEIAQSKADSAEAKDAQAQADALVNAPTKEASDAAADDLLNHL